MRKTCQINVGRSFCTVVSERFIFPFSYKSKMENQFQQLITDTFVVDTLTILPNPFIWAPLSLRAVVFAYCLMNPHKITPSSFFLSSDISFHKMRATWWFSVILDTKRRQHEGSDSSIDAVILCCKSKISTLRLHRRESIQVEDVGGASWDNWRGGACPEWT